MSLPQEAQFQQKLLAEKNTTTGLLPVALAGDAGGVLHQEQPALCGALGGLGGLGHRLWLWTLVHLCGLVDPIMAQLALLGGD